MKSSILRTKRFWASLVIVGFSLWFNQSKSYTFSVERITSKLPYNAEWAIPQLPQDELKPILGQNYRYLASGTQSYAFLSDDGRYVIKFFRMKHLVPSLSDYLKPGRVEKRQDNLQSIFKAYKQAYDDLKTESGLVYIHLNKTSDLNQKMTIADRLGRVHTIDLDQMEFIVQERAELLFTRLKKLYDAGDEEGAKRAINSVLTLVKQRIEKGYADQDKAVSHNYGFVGDRPIHLDIGRLFKGKKEGEYERIEARINTWLKENGYS
jgi:hypothetical protein